MIPEVLLQLIRQSENSGVEFKLHPELLPVSASTLADLDRARLTDYFDRALTDKIP